MNALTSPTPENVAEMLTSGDGDLHDGNDWKISLYAVGSVLNIGITPFADDDEGTRLPQVNFRAVVIEGDQPPIVLEQPAELGLQWDDGGDLLTLDERGILFTLRGIDSWDFDPAGARELAAQLAAMADAYEATGGGQ